MIWEMIPGQLFQSNLLVAWMDEYTHKFDLVINCTHSTNIPSDNLVVVQFPFHDVEAYLPDEKYLDVVSGIGANAVKKGLKVLTHCFAGQNRSSLINALILVKLGICATGGATVDYIRQRRPKALTNKRFVQYLEQYDGRTGFTERNLAGI